MGMGQPKLYWLTGLGYMLFNTSPNAPKQKRALGCETDRMYPETGQPRHSWMTKKLTKIMFHRGQ